MFSKVKNHFYATPRVENNIRHIFKPLYVVLTMFGLFPYSIKFNNSKRGLTIIKKSIYINSLCAVSYLLLLFSFLALHVQYVYDSIGDTNMTREIMTQMNYILELIIFIIFCLSAYFCAFSNRCKYVNIINKIGYLIGPPNMNKNSAMKHFQFQVNTVMSLLLLALLLQIFVNFSRDSTFWKMVLVCISFLLPQMIQFTVVAFYYVMILMLVVLLENIREHIENLTKDKTNVMDCYINAKTKILTLQYVECLYAKAFEVKREISEAFQAPLLITTVQCFHSMVSEAHIIYHGLVMERDFSIHPIINCSIWIIYQIIKIYVMARSGNLLKLEVS